MPEPWVVRSALAAVALSLGFSATADCLLPTDLPNAVPALIDELEPDLAPPGPVATPRELDALFDWVSERDAAAGTGRAQTVAALAAVGQLAHAYGLDPSIHHEGTGGLELPPGWSAAARRRVTAIGLAITSRRAGGEVLAAGVYWNTPVLERVRIVRVPSGLHAADLAELAGLLGPIVSTCAVQVTDWVVLSHELATDLLASADGLWMLAFGGQRGPQQPSGWSTWIRDSEIGEALTFDHPAVMRAASYSAVFYGRGPSLTWTLRNAGRATTTLGVRDFGAWLRGLFP